MSEDSNVKIDDKTQRNIQAFINKINAATAGVQLIVDTYINAKGLEGEYTLSPDRACLIKRETKDGGT